MTDTYVLSGIDGSGKTEVASQIAQIASMKLPKVGVVEKPSYVEGTALRGRRYLFRRGTDALNLSFTVGDLIYSKLNRPEVLMIGNAAYCSFHKWQERKLKTDYDPAKLILVRDRILDSAVYAPLYYPSLKKITMIRRMAFFERLYGRTCYLKLVYLDVKPAVAAERIRKRVDDKSLSPGNSHLIHTHENLEKLTLLSEQFNEGLSVLKKQGAPIQIIQNGKSLEESVEQVLGLMDLNERSA